MERIAGSIKVGDASTLDVFVAVGVAIVLILLAQAFRIAISRIKRHNSMRVYRRKAIAEGFCHSYERILSGSSHQISKPWWRKVDARIPGQAYREALRTMANRRQIESYR